MRRWLLTKQSNNKAKEKTPQKSEQIGSSGEEAVQGLEFQLPLKRIVPPSYPVQWSRSLGNVNLIPKTGTVYKYRFEVFPLAPFITAYSCDFIHFKHYGKQGSVNVLPGYFCQNLVPWEWAI